MSFLQGWMLWALPAIALPILIHLIHKRRHRVVEWGAMMFLLQGAKMSKGLQRLRHILLLILRTLAVLGLVVGLGRPIAGGWLGGLGGERPDVVLVLLDRSASMSEEVADGDTKLDVAVRRVAAALENVHANRWACIDSVTGQVVELEAPSNLADLPIARATSSVADLPGMLELAAEHLRANDAGRAEIWICSDAQISDWRPEDGRWSAIRDSLLAMPAGVRVNVLSFAERSPENLSIRVEQAERVTGSDRTELSLDLRVHAGAGTGEPRQVPVAVNLAGARTVVQVELVGDEALLEGHRIAIDAEEGIGWGWVELPQDPNPADDRFYFTYGQAATQETVVVAEDTEVADVLRIAAEAPTSERVDFAVRVLRAEDAGSLDLAGASLLLWQAPLPEDETAVEVENFVAAGGRVVFLPPEEPSGAVFLGSSWGPLQEIGSDDAPASPTYWRRDGDLLRSGEDGTELAVDEVHVRLMNQVQGDVTSLASFGDGEVLLARAPTSRGGVYFLGALPTTRASNLANQGVVMVAVVHRALAAASAAADSQSQQDAGSFVPVAGEWGLVSESDDDWLLAEHLYHAGVVTDGESFVALNRSVDEDRSSALAGERLEGLLPDVDVNLVEGPSESSGLIEEIWRLFLYAMLLALVGEALLCVGESSGEVVES